MMICDRLVCATANGVYQGILVTLLAGLALASFNRTNAATRYAVLFGLLLFVGALIPAHWVLASHRPTSEIAGKLRGSATTTPKDSAVQLAALDEGAGEVISLPPADANREQEQALDQDRAGVTSAAELTSPVVVEPATESILARSANDSSGEADGLRWRSYFGEFLPAQLGSLEKAVLLPRPVCLCLWVMWAVLACLRLFSIVAGLREVRRAKADSTAPDAEMVALFERVRSKTGARREVQLRISEAQYSPMVLGFLNPVVILPAEMGRKAQAGEVEHVLRHELAHVERRDDWANLVQQGIQAVLFFHPAVWWISSRLSLEREIACDDCVLEAGDRPREYALTLANVASRLLPSRQSLAPGVSNNRTQLKQRINMILNTQRNRSSRLARSRLGIFTLSTAMLAVLTVSAGPRLVQAQSSASTTVEKVADTTPLPPKPEVPDVPVAEAGPRVKVSTRYAVAPRAVLVVGEEQPTAPATPALPAPPTPPVAVTVPGYALAPVPVVTPDVPEAPSAVSINRARKRNASVEERLARIESILSELQARNAKGLTYHYEAADMAKVAADYKHSADEARKMADEARHSAEVGREAALAGRLAAEKGQRDMELAMRDLSKLRNKDLASLNESLTELRSDAPAIELEALRQARQSLNKEVQAIERQIRRLEEEQSHTKKPAKAKTINIEADTKPEPSPKP